MTTVHLAARRRGGVDQVTVRGRRAVTAVFFLNGLTLGSYIVRLPSLKVGLQLGTVQLGLVSTLFGVAALVAMQFVGGLVSRFGSARLIRVTMFALPLVLVGVGLGRGFAGLSVAAVVLGGVHGTTDVSMNAHAVAVERRLGRPVMSGCHAAWSVSAAVASLVGAGVIAAGVAPVTHFLGIAAVVLVGGLVVGPFLLPASADRTGVEAPGVDGAGVDGAGTVVPGRRYGWTRAVVALGLTGFVLMIGEGAALTWSGVFLHDTRGTSLAVASTAITAYTACQTVGRLVGDRLTVRYGAGNLFRAGGLVATAGFALAVLSPHPAGAVAGFAIAGLGGSALMPLTFSAAGRAGGAGPGAAALVARLTTFTYAGILAGPALIGWVAVAIGLQWTLGLVVLLLAAVALLTRLPAGSST
jgi:MFS family permease